MRFSPDIREAARDSVRQMIEFLVAEYGLSKIEAYMLCSIAGDLRMHEVVRSSPSATGNLVRQCRCTDRFAFNASMHEHFAGRHAELRGECAVFEGTVSGQSVVC